MITRNKMHKILWLIFALLNLGLAMGILADGVLNGYTSNLEQLVYSGLFLLTCSLFTAGMAYLKE